MRASLFFLLMFAGALGVSDRAFSAAPPPDAPLVEDKGIKVDALDVEAALMRIPEERRADFRTSYDRVLGVVDSVFVTRTFAEKARALGLDRDPVVQRRLQQVQEDILADAYGRTLQKEALAVNLEQRAHELYLADKPKFVAPEAVHVQHILIGLNARTREMARVRAEEAYAKLKAGEDFLAVAARYSDDPEKSLNKGDLGFNRPAKFVPPLREQIAKMSRKGDISAPVESEFGYHIVKFIERQPTETLSFEAVKKGLMAAEREKILKQKFDAAVTEVRSSPTAIAHRENVEALVVPIDDATMKRALEAQEALGKAFEAKKAK